MSDDERSSEDLEDPDWSVTLYAETLQFPRPPASPSWSVSEADTSLPATPSSPTFPLQPFRPLRITKRAFSPGAVSRSTASSFSTVLGVEDEEEHRRAALHHATPLTYGGRLASWSLVLPRRLPLRPLTVFPLHRPGPPTTARSPAPSPGLTSSVEGVEEHHSPSPVISPHSLRRRPRIMIPNAWTQRAPPTPPTPPPSAVDSVSAAVELCSVGKEADDDEDAPKLSPLVAPPLELSPYGGCVLEPEHPASSPVSLSADSSADWTLLSISPASSPRPSPPPRRPLPPPPVPPKADVTQSKSAPALTLTPALAPLRSRWSTSTLSLARSVSAVAVRIYPRCAAEFKDVHVVEAVHVLYERQGPGLYVVVVDEEQQNKVQAVAFCAYFEAEAGQTKAAYGGGSVSSSSWYNSTRGGKPSPKNSPAAAALYPVLTLPHDIVSEIFLQCIDGYEIGIPVTLASVCSPWRAVALHTHGIWTQFEARLGQDRNPQPVEDLFRIYVSRSGSLPLDIRMHGPDSRKPTHENMFRLLGECSTRWRNVTFSPTSDVSAWRQVGLYPNLLDAPNLVEVGFLEMNVPAEWRFSFPWSQLTILRFNHVGLLGCIKILEHTPNLELLEVESEDYMERAISPPRALLLPRLHTLILRLCESQRILPHLILPVLREIDIGDYAIWWWRSETQELLTRSGCALETLRLSFTNIDDGGQAVTNLLEAFTSFLDGFIRDSPALPALEFLELKRCEAKMALQPLVRMLCHRRSSSAGEGKELPFARLASFKLSFDQDPYEFERRLESHDEEHDKWVPINMNQQSAEMQAALVRLGELRAGGLQADLRSDFKWFDEYITAGIIEELQS
ncbi:hypothetical protein FB45DRAFT_1056038 [Roridomyces roridus]|uniref:F-box domain-containing protein n=1 Tax=Roridomyces roridus TaxID=1738132 RepID=A0AAD7C3G6_9AGAR|nr:hypothetical protein FB45DRAFT_1056038 [Roridomyces roridus]